MFFSTKPFVTRTAGFTLLEMLVVVLLVAMLSGVLMQGFVYMSRVYGSVERRQDLALSQYLLEGWLKDTVQGLVNGIDGPLGEGVYFEGDETFFRGITLEPLVGLQGDDNRVDDMPAPRIPHKIEWRIEKTDNAVRLKYGEAPLTSETWQWYNVREWKAAEASLSYWHEGRLLSRFSALPQSFGVKKSTLLPLGIVLTVNSVRTQSSVFVALHSSPNKYRPPEAVGG